VVALTVLIAGGLSVVTLLSAALQHERELAGRESVLRDADRVLATLSLYSRTDLDRRVGRHPAGRFWAEIRRPEPALYRLALFESDTGRTEILVTVVHRPREEAP
jgi:hypothetical protein